MTAARGQQRAGHDLAPLEDVAADQVGDDADCQHQSGRSSVEIRQRIQKCAPATVKAKIVAAMMPGIATGMKIRHSICRPAAPSISAASSSSLGSSEVADHDPGAERHRQRRIREHQAPEIVDQRSRSNRRTREIWNNGMNSSEPGSDRSGTRRSPASLPQNPIRARLNAASTEITIEITTTRTVTITEFRKKSGSSDSHQVPEVLQRRVMNTTRDCRLPPKSPPMISAGHQRVERRHQEHHHEQRQRDVAAPQRPCGRRSG